MKKKTITREVIISKLTESTRNTAESYYTKEQIDRFADFCLDKMDEDTDSGFVAESLMDFYRDTIEVRRCSVCGRYMREGYCQGGGEAYYRSDECLHSEFTDEQWQEECESDEQSYDTEWY